MLCEKQQTRIGENSSTSLYLVSYTKQSYLNIII